MTELIAIHPQNPQPRLVLQVVECLRDGGVIVYPTDSSYALGCDIDSKDGMERIRRLRHLDDKHHFTLVCRDLSEIATYALVENSAYRLMKALTPGAYTFLLRATREVPRRLQHPKRKTIGLRVPDNTITQAILEAHGRPLMSSTLLLPGEELPLTDPEEMRERLHGQVDMIVDGGFCGMEQTTVVDLVQGVPEVVREGKGETSIFEG